MKGVTIWILIVVGFLAVAEKRRPSKGKMEIVERKWEPKKKEPIAIETEKKEVHTPLYTPKSCPPDNDPKRFCECSMDYRGSSLQLSAPDKYARETFSDVLEVVGLTGKAYGICRAEELPDDFIAFATHSMGIGYMVYDGSYFDQASKIQIEATTGHELSHLLELHSWANRSKLWKRQMDKEIVAEEYSGFILGRLGRSYQELVDAFAHDFSPSTDTHPSGQESYEAIIKGWKKGRLANHIGQSSLEPTNKKPHPLEEKISPELDQETLAKDVVVSFIEALGSDLDKAYGLHRNEKWDSKNHFKSVKGYGGITQTKILDPPAFVACHSGSNEHCSKVKYLVKYFADDPYSDGCRGQGKVYLQFFELKWYESLSDYRIVKTKLKDSYCMESA